MLIPTCHKSLIIQGATYNHQAGNSNPQDGGTKPDKPQGGDKSQGGDKPGGEKPDGGKPDKNMAGMPDENGNAGGGGTPTAINRTSGNTSNPGRGDSGGFASRWFHDAISPLP